MLRHKWGRESGSFSIDDHSVNHSVCGYVYIPARLTLTPPMQLRWHSSHASWTFQSSLPRTANRGAPGSLCQPSETCPCWASQPLCPHMYRSLYLCCSLLHCLVLCEFNSKHAWGQSEALLTPSAVSWNFVAWDQSVELLKVRFETPDAHFTAWVKANSLVLSLMSMHCWYYPRSLKGFSETEWL